MNRGDLLLQAAVAGTPAEAPSLQERHDRILQASNSLGAGGKAVLDEAYHALLRHKRRLAGLEDLWAFALKEGRTRFGRADLWETTGPQTTGDMLGQTTIGPWQLTIDNARIFGAAYGLQPDWSGAMVARFLRSRPAIQADLAADFVEHSYALHGRRTPEAIQSYFWLEAFLKGEIGQGPWYASVLGRTPEERKNTGFYAKQLLLGSRTNPQGLLFWLYITGDHGAVRETIDAWKRAGHPVAPEDLAHCSCEPDFRRYLEGLL
jgi:hypothetical protein